MDLENRKCYVPRRCVALSIRRNYVPHTSRLRYTRADEYPSLAPSPIRGGMGRGIKRDA